MTYGEALKFAEEKMLPLLHKRMGEIYPDMYVVANTRDPEEYKKANPCMYRWYMKFANIILNLDIRQISTRSEEELLESNYTCVERFYNELETTDDVLKFLIENSQPK